MTQTDFIGHSDQDLIYMIAEKTAEEISEINPEFIESIGGYITLAEVAKAVHDINPLSLDEMLEGRPQDRSHDLLGMLQYYDWASNKLTECFSPRYTK